MQHSLLWLGLRTESCYANTDAALYQSSLDRTFIHSTRFFVTFTVALYRERASVLSHNDFMLIYTWTLDFSLVLLWVKIICLKWFAMLKLAVI